MMKSKIKKLLLIIAVLPLLAHHCDEPDYSIELNDDYIASRTDDRDNNTLDFETDLENPIISGHILLPELEFTYTDRRVEAGFTRTLIKTNGDYFIDSHYNEFISITSADNSIRKGTQRIYRYETPPIALPNDGSLVRLELNVDGTLVTYGNVRLASDVMVLPVHVYIFKQESREIDSDLSERNVRSWFDLPNISTSAVTIGDPISGPRTVLQTNVQGVSAPIYNPVDPIWRQAKIQFKLESYNVIVNDELETQIIASNDRRFPPSTIHNNNREIGGIHIYVGRNGENYSRRGLNIVAGITESANNCLDVVHRNRGIALAWDEAIDSRNSLAHEIGHILGLGHVDQPFEEECSSGLIGPSDEVGNNLMTTSAGRTILTQGQINRAREMACRYLNHWGIPSTGCSTAMIKEG